MVKFPVRGADGKVFDRGTIAIDVIKRKRAEARRAISYCQGGVSVHSKWGEPNLVELIGMFAEAPIGFCCIDKNLKLTSILDHLGLAPDDTKSNPEIC